MPEFGTSGLMSGDGKRGGAQRQCSRPSSTLPVEVWTRRGLQRYIVLFFIELSTRRVEIAGIASVANGLWMSQIARNISDTVDGLLTGKRYLIHDRDPLFTAEFLNILADSGVKSVKLPPRSPNLNAYAERFVRTIKESCLDRMILFGEDSLRKSVQGHCLYNVVVVERCSGIVCCNSHNLNCTLHHSRSLYG